VRHRRFEAQQVRRREQQRHAPHVRVADLLAVGVQLHEVGRQDVGAAARRMQEEAL